MTLALLIAGGWIVLSLVALPLIARVFHPHPACRAGVMHRCPDYAACTASGTCLAAARKDAAGGPATGRTHQ